MMNILWTLLIGLAAGGVAKLLVPGRQGGGCILTTILGVAGAFLATYLGQALGLYRAGQPAGFIGAIIGAVIILIIFEIIRKKR